MLCVVDALLRGGVRMVSTSSLTLPNINTTISSASSLVCAFLLTPFVGRKIAQDEEFKNKYIPSWYDYTIERPKSAWTKEELHEQMVAMQRQLHERAIKGEFTPEKLEEMRRNFDKVRPEKEEHAHFAKLHPGVDDDEELED
jgi:hypothetical protein